jgi:hypothetical protein
MDNNLLMKCLLESNGEGGMTYFMYHETVAEAKEHYKITVGLYDFRVGHRKIMFTYFIVS